MADENERETRRQRIDKKLRECGWEIVTFDSNPDSYINHAVEEYPTSHGPADYALFYEGKIIGIIEAKKLSIGPQSALVQAQRYAKGVSSPFNFNGFRVPFIYSTNGEIIWFQDLRPLNSYSRKVSKFHTPEALWEMLQKDFEKACQWFVENPNQHSKLRPYQIAATESIEKAISQGKRELLVAMATGTGKTYTVVSEIYRLMRSGAARRILFLVDRRALAAQAALAFSTFEAEPGQKFDQIYEVYTQRFRKEDLEGVKFNPEELPEGYLTDPKPSYVFVYISTIQRMRITLFDWESAFESRADDPEDEGDAGKQDIPIHAFDVIIADECHRGYTATEEGKWREVLDYFDAIKIGLTATPAAHTVAYFGEPIFRYGYEEAVRDGYLVDYDAVAISSDVRIKGIFLQEGERIGEIDPETGLEKLDRLEDERFFDASEIERKITSPDSNQKIIQEIAKYALEHEEKYGRFPKTLIFAVNDLPHISHADQVVRICREVFGRGDDFVQKITGKMDRPLQRIREFRNRPKPGIVVTVDMLTTGVDIPALEFIVFMRPVKSRILFEQMMGRGTRKYDEIGKTHFTVFDCFSGSLLEYFRNVSAFTIDPPLKLSRPISEIIENIYQNRDRDYNIRILVKRLQRVAKNMSGEAYELFEKFIPDGDIGRFATELHKRLKDDFAGTMKILRDPELQDLLNNYPKAKKAFYVAYDAQDDVKSETVIRTPIGEYLKPEDYIEAFSRFVRENRDKIEGIKILLERPSDWSTGALHELLRKLRENRFTEDKLRRAYHNEMADIISMVKHAASEENPLLTAQERVDRAIKRITEGREFTEEQLKWLNLIKAHLEINLAIDREDFDEIPAFTRKGGWKVANKVFDNLEELLKEINEAVAA
jgi:type I restriction enzyme R subunit